MLELLPTCPWRSGENGRMVGIRTRGNKYRKFRAEPSALLPVGFRTRLPRHRCSIVRVFQAESPLCFFGPPPPKSYPLQTAVIHRADSTGGALCFESAPFVTAKL